MTRVVEEVAAEYENVLTWEKIVTKELAGATRYNEFSKSLGRPAPIPSIAIEGELIFDTTPSTEALRSCINRFVDKLRR
jgi:hypothetical protein